MPPDQYQIDEGPDAGLMGYLMRIRPHDLREGHFVVQMSVPWEKTNFPLRGVLINSIDTRKWMMDHCDWVDIDINRSPNKFRPSSYLKYVHKQDPGSLAPEQVERCEQVRTQRITSDTLKASSKLYFGLNEEVDRIISDLGHQDDVRIDTAKQVITEIAGSLNENVAALSWLIRIKDVDDYTAQHCINVAILSIALAHAAGWPREQVEEAGLAGLLHDLGKMRLDQAILNKPDRLTAEEFEHIKAHSMAGYQMLRKDEGIPESVRQAVRSHHERPDGSGYPDGIAGEIIPEVARLVAIVDAYDAITSNRVYDPARSHHEALGILYKERGRQFDGELVEVFIRLLGWVTYGT
ncbi:MAG: HD domain-containing phosphohydrolase, partial [Pseudomonadota bacterium]